MLYYTAVRMLFNMSPGIQLKMLRTHSVYFPSTLITQAVEHSNKCRMLEISIQLCKYKVMISNLENTWRELTMHKAVSIKFGTNNFDANLQYSKLSY